MARGEQDQKNDRSVGIAIFAVFLVVCLFVAYLVADAWVVHEPLPPPDDAEPGWRAPLTALDLRDCGRRLRTGHQDVTSVEVDEELARRGYLPAGPWSDPSGFPLSVTTDALDGSCGLIAFVPHTSGTITDARVAGSGVRRHPCQRTLTVAACGASVSANASGWGEARSRVFVLPGVSDQSELPPEVLLAHLEAESALGAIGWRASDAAWVADITIGGSTPEPTPPATGCKPWVVVGQGTPSRPVSTWNGVPLGTSAGGDLFIAGVVRCAGETDGLTIDTGFPGTLTWRSYTPDVSAPRLERVVPTIPRVVRDERDL